MDADNKPTFETWASLELMGHQRIAGLVTEQTIAGVGFIRVDVPATETTPAHTRLYSPHALYSITPTGEAEAKAITNYLRARPIEPFMLAGIEAPVQPVGVSREDDDLCFEADNDDDDDEDEYTDFGDDDDDTLGDGEADELKSHPIVGDQTATDLSRVQGESAETAGGQEKPAESDSPF